MTREQYATGKVSRVCVENEIALMSIRVGVSTDVNQAAIVKRADAHATAHP